MLYIIITHTNQHCRHKCSFKNIFKMHILRYKEKKEWVSTSLSAVKVILRPDRILKQRGSSLFFTNISKGLQKDNRQPSTMQHIYIVDPLFGYIPYILTQIHT